MNIERITVRQWQENYRAGAYRSKEVDIQRAAGWWNWNCRDDALAGRLRLIAPVVMKLNEPFLLDHYRVWFVNEGKWRKAVYDSVRFEPLDGGSDDIKFFKVDLRSPEESDNWTLYTKRFGLHAPEFGCCHVHDMAKYISAMARELEQGVRPPFLDEKAAAVEYILFRDTVLPSLPGPAKGGGAQLQLPGPGRWPKENRPYGRQPGGYTPQASRPRKPYRSTDFMYPARMTPRKPLRSHASARKNLTKRRRPSVER